MNRNAVLPSRWLLEVEILPSGGEEKSGYASIDASRGSLPMRKIRSALDGGLQVVLRVCSWLALPIVILLFLQWPLRDIFRAYSREANDLGQWIFAVYVAVSVTAATRAGMHLGTDAVARLYSDKLRRNLVRAGAVLLVPWAAFVLVGSKETVLNSIRGLEAFPDTNNPGYFLIKTALWILAVLILLQALLDLAQPRRTQ
jgi:TRAP-type C4-dicarboxylate transport system permease small subunit